MLPSLPSIVIAGGGPAGLAVLLAAHRRGRLDALLARGVILVDKGNTIGAGDLGRYAIGSDSTGRTFADCLEGPSDSPLAPLRRHPLARAVAEAGDGPVPLDLAGHFLTLVGEALTAVVDAHPRCRVLAAHEVLSARRRDGRWEVRVRGPRGDVLAVSARHVVSATGADQPLDRLETERVGGVPLRRYRDRLLQSGDVLAHGGLRVVADRLAASADPRVAIVGGSTSAVSVAHAVLNRLSAGARLGPKTVTLLHRRPLRLTYSSASEALADGYDEFGPDDLCPLSGRVFRLAGFRLTQRELVMRARGIGGRPPEPRLALHRVAEEGFDEEVPRILDRATVVVAALGYRPRALPFLDESGDAIPLLAGTRPDAKLVDRACRILDHEGVPLDRAWGIGLAAGFVPDGPLGGEPSFRGQANGLWLWQNDVGFLIASAILDDDDGEPVAWRPTDAATAASQAALELAR